MFLAHAPKSDAAMYESRSGASTGPRTASSRASANATPNVSGEGCVGAGGVPVVDEGEGRCVEKEFGRREDIVGVGGFGGCGVQEEGGEVCG